MGTEQGPEQEEGEFTKQGGNLRPVTLHGRDSALCQGRMIKGRQSISTGIGQQGTKTGTQTAVIQDRLQENLKKNFFGTSILKRERSQISERVRIVLMAKWRVI